MLVLFHGTSVTSSNGMASRPTQCAPCAHTGSGVALISRYIVVSPQARPLAGLDQSYRFENWGPSRSAARTLTAPRHYTLTPAIRRPHRLKAVLNRPRPRRGPLETSRASNSGEPHSHLAFALARSPACAPVLAKPPLPGWRNARWLAGSIWLWVIDRPRKACARQTQLLPSKRAQSPRRQKSPWSLLLGGQTDLGLLRLRSEHSGPRPASSIYPMHVTRAAASTDNNHPLIVQHAQADYPVRLVMGATAAPRVLPSAA